MSRLAWVMGDNAYAEQLAGKAEALYELFNGLFWMDDMGTFALALDKNKKPCRVRTSNPGHLLYCGIVPEDRAEKLVKMLMSEEMFTGWGIRTVSSNETLYNPVSYHNGSVWPHDTGICAAGFARYGYFREAEKILQSLFEASRYCPHRVLPELFCGFDRQEDRGIVFFPAACSPQAWAAGAVFMALEAAMGLEQTGDEGFKIANNRSSLFSKLQIAAGEEDGASIFSVVPWEKNRE
jgi:glycogen debranching enzyme